MSLCSLGHLATISQLRDRGWTRSRLAHPSVIRLRQGVYACAHLRGPLVTAARTGGALTCVSVLRESGVWAGHDRRVHVQVPPTSSRQAGGTRLHWERPTLEMETPWRAGRPEALRQAVRCLDTEDAVAALESAIRTGFLPEHQVRGLVALAPRRVRRLEPLVIANSGSGNETLVRLRLIAAGHRVDAQTEVPGLGHQDLLVDGRVAIEVDSKRWHGHDIRELDVDRDLVSFGLGRPVIRILPKHVHEQWSSTLAVIERAVRDADRG